MRVLFLIITAILLATMPALAVPETTTSEAPVVALQTPAPQALVATPASASPSTHAALAAGPTIAVPAAPLPEPFLYRGTSEVGLAAIQIKPVAGPAMAIVTPQALRLRASGATLSVSPALRAAANGQSTLGAMALVEVPAMGLKVTHLSFLGDRGGHDTRADLTLTDRIELRAQHAIDARGNGRTLVGPTVRLVDNLKLWYAVSPQGGSTVMLTGTARF